MRAVLLEDAADFTTIVRPFFALEGIGLDVVHTQDEVVRLVRLQVCRLVFVDCSSARPEEIARCAQLVKRLRVPTYVFHMHEEAVRPLRAVALCPLEWISLQIGLLCFRHLLRSLVALHDDLEGPWARLTEQERTVLQLIGAGHKNHEIAQTLAISPATVKTHTANLRIKLGVTHRADLATIAQISRPALSLVDSAVSETEPAASGGA